MYWISIRLKFNHSSSQQLHCVTMNRKGWSKISVSEPSRWQICRRSCMNEKVVPYQRFDFSEDHNFDIPSSFVEGYRIDSNNSWWNHWFQAKFETIKFNKKDRELPSMPPPLDQLSRADILQSEVSLSYIYKWWSNFMLKVVLSRME